MSEAPVEPIRVAAANSPRWFFVPRGPSLRRCGSPNIVTGIDTNPKPTAFRADESAHGYTVIPATKAHLADIARLHVTGINRGFLSELGEGFLRRLYGAMLDHSGSAVFVAQHKGDVVGFSSVTEDLSQMYRWVVVHRFYQVGLPILWKMTSWRRIRRVFENVFYPASRDLADLPRAELLSVSVSSEHQRRGLGRSLVHARLDWLRGRGVKRVRVFSTEGLKANPMFNAMGFTLAMKTEHHGQPVNVYIYEIP